MTLPNRTIDFITGELHVALRRGTTDILTIGGLLSEAREKVPHGEWLPWLKNEFSMSERSAQKYIKATSFAAKYELGADFNVSPSALFLISRYDQREICGRRDQCREGKTRRARLGERDRRQEAGGAERPAC